MADPYQYLTPSGVIVPDTSTILTEVKEEWQNAFGADLITTPDTPQGVMISAEALARSNAVNNNAAVANQINPNVAGGVFLDAILSLTNPLGRNVQTPTSVENVTVTGVAGTVIPIGAQAKTSAGDLFETTAEVTIPDSGTTTVNFQSAQYGPIPCAADELDTIVTAVLGWETVNNDEDGTLGSTTQSDQAARAYRRNTLAFQGLSLAEAITSALYAVPGVSSLHFQENVASTTTTINGISMVSHSVYACIDGGSDAAVAAALLENKSSGSAWNGDTEVTVVEPSSGQEYTVQFDRPDVIGILVEITVTGATTDNVKKAIVDYADGLINGLAGFVVGADVSPFEISGAVMAENPACYVSLVRISHTSPISWTTSPIEIGVNEIAHTQNSYITVIVG